MRTLKVLDSNVISQVDYDHVAMEMKVHFIQTDSIWMHSDVPPGEFAEIASAWSVGQCYNERIRNVYPAKRIDPPATAATV